MNSLKIALSTYFFFLALALIAPASEDYDYVVWKLVVGQVYAIPAFIIVFFVSKFFLKKPKT